MTLETIVHRYRSNKGLSVRVLDGRVSLGIFATVWIEEEEYIEAFVRGALISRQAGLGIPRMLITETANQLQLLADQKQKPVEHPVSLLTEHSIERLQHLFIDLEYQFPQPGSSISENRLYGQRIYQPRTS